MIQTENEGYWQYSMFLFVEKYENASVFGHMNSKFAKCANMTQQFCFYQNQCGLSSTLNYGLIPNSWKWLSKIFLEKVEGKKLWKF
jgi:hypothetical protein